MQEKSGTSKPNVLLGIALFLLLLAISTTGMGIVTAMTSDGQAGARMIIGIIVAIISWLAGIFCLLKWFRYRKENPDYKPTTIMFVIFAVLFLSLAVTLPRTLRIMYSSVRFDMLLRPHIRDTYAEENVPVPENPRFMFFRLDDKKFLLPVDGYPFGTTDPEEVNVIVAYRVVDKERTKKDIRRTDLGDQLLEETRIYSYTGQSVDLYVIRLSDWSLIAQREDMWGSLIEEDDAVNMDPRVDLSGDAAAFLAEVLDGEPPARQ